MLTITIPEFEIYNSTTNEFITVKTQELNLEHSLVSISKWESKWKKAFWGPDKKTNTETLDYIRCMTINSKNVDPIVYTHIPESAMKQIIAYIEDPMTASTVTNNVQNDVIKSINENKKVTSEEIYWQMITLGIPFECERWHINRLNMLIRVCNAKNNPSKMNKAETLKSYKNLNEVRRKEAEAKRKAK